MKTLILLALFLVSIRPNFAEDTAPFQRYGATLYDPRHPVNLHQMLENGEEPKVFRNISNSIMIICWMPAPNMTFDTYQISGLAGYHTKEQVEKFLTKFYEADQPKEAATDFPNIILAGNNWGAGMDLKETLQKLSAKRSLAVYYVGGWPFSKVSLIEEPELQKQLIDRSYREANK